MKLFYSKFIVLIFVIQFFQSNAQNISQQLVGTNVWYTNPSQQVWNLTAEMGTKTIRIGGHAYDDNMPSKTTLLNWVKKIQAMGAEPIIQVSQYQSAVAAADLVRYLNVEKSDEIAPVKFWNIGNEPWLQNGRPSLSTVGAMVETYFKPRAEAMKEVDPTIKIYGPDFCYYIEPAINDLFGGKNDIAGKIPGKEYYYCDGISWHRYPQDENINLAYQGIEDFRSSIVKCKNKVDAVNAAYNRTGDDALVWGIGEFNAKGGPQVHTWENGQMFGGILGLCMKYSAKYATSWSMFENGGNRQGTDFSLIDGENMTPRASYRHMEFVAKYFKGEYIDGTSSSNDFVVYGAQDETQTAVMIMHRASGSSKEYTLLLNDTATSDASFKLKINAGLIGSYSDIITPRTTQVLIFHGDSITKINYSAEDFDNELPPVYSLLKLGQVLPEKPSGLQVNSVSYNSVTLTWNDNSGNETGFIVEIEEEGRFKIITVLPPDSTSYTNKGLLPETSYKFKISAYNSLGKSEYSEVVSAITLETPAAVAFKGPHSIPGKIEAENFNANEA
ncbi:MAG TPA: fibronectin type III domain-containing protein, partial [Prolixibacteraceae bacterium]|nr:fibronectin type III domain-containing protein [Prolixibacteraceae bacterium]